MANFKEAFSKTSIIEGGYVFDKDDSGGETYKGISRNNFPNWKGWSKIDLYHAVKPSALDFLLSANNEIQTLVESFYKAEFWDKLKLDYIDSQAVANELYDTAVNCGVGISALFLQQSLNVTNRNGIDYPDIIEDAVIGSTTVTTMNKHPRPADVLKVLNVLQGARYIDICRANKKQEKFFRGWLSRVSLS